MVSLHQCLKLSVGWRDSTKVTPYWAWQQHVSSGSISLSISAGSPGNFSSRKPCPGLLKSTQTTAPAFSWSWLEIWEFPSGGGGDPRTVACGSEGLLLMETRVAVTFHLLAGDSPIPHASPLMCVWKDPRSTEATPSTTSAPSERDAAPVLDLGLLSPSTTAATSYKAGCWLTSVWNSLHSPLAGCGKKKKMLKACQYQAQERLFFIYCWDIKDRGNIEAALEELGGRLLSIGSVGQIKVEDVYGVKLGSVFRKLVGKFSWDRRSENKNAERERRDALPCLAVFIENWTVLKSDIQSWAATDFPARLVPAIHTLEIVLWCAQGYFGAGGYFKKHQQGRAHQCCHSWTLGGVNLAYQHVWMFGLTAKSSEGKWALFYVFICLFVWLLYMYLRPSLKVSMHCMRQLYFMWLKWKIHFFLLLTENNIGL